MQYETSIFQDDDKWKITIQRPILTPEEYQRRLNRVKKAAAELVKCAVNLEGQKSNDKDIKIMESKKN